MAESIGAGKTFVGSATADRIYFISMDLSGLKNLSVVDRFPSDTETIYNRVYCTSK